jgi:LacI family transcriptional regulator
MESASYQRWMQAHKVDGFILNRLRTNDPRVSWLLENKFPFASLEQAGDERAYVEVGGRRAMAQLVAHLVEGGHRRLAFIGSKEDELVIHQQRLEGFQQGLRAQGMSLRREYLQSGDLTRQSGYEAALRLLALPEPPTAILCINDLTALGVLHAAREAGVQVGSALAVTGFDGIDESAHSTPPLTTIDQPVYDIARRLVRLLVAQINGDESVEQQIRLEPRLVVRASSEADPTPFPSKPLEN